MSAELEHDPHAFWRDALAGKNPPIHEGGPQEGYYRCRREKGGPWEPVGIWRENGKMIAHRGPRDADPVEIWTWVANKPIPYEVYIAVMDGEPWPDDITREVEAAKAEIGHNSGLPHEEVLDEIRAVDAAFAAWLAEVGSIQSEEHDAKAETFRTRLHALGKKAEDTRVEEKKPHLEACKTIDATWKPVVDAAETGKKKIGAVVLDYRVARDNARKAEEARAREAARQAQEAAAREHGSDLPLPALAPAPAPVAVARPKGFRTVEVLVVSDPLAAVTAILKASPNQADLMEAIQKVAARMIKAGVDVPGASFQKEQRV